ncbi:nuclease [Mortierella alpina]|nr:nuclease [Mortierella alpina]
MFGYPAPVADIGVAKRFITAYNRRTRNPHWSAEYLTKQNLLPKDPDNAPSREENWFEDSTIPAAFRARLSPYSRSGYDRGHQTPAADAKVNQTARDEVYVLSNVTPRIGDSSNRNYWAGLENFVRDLTNRFDHVFVFTGSLYIPANAPYSDPPSSRKDNVAHEVLYGTQPGVDRVAPTSVPTHFYKVLLAVKGDLDDPASSQALGSFILPNAPIASSKPLSEFVVDIGKVEVFAGVVFFDKIERTAVARLCDATTCSVLSEVSAVHK